MAPLLLTDLFGKVDIDAKFISGNYGETVVPRAIRHGTSLCIAALFPEYREILRLGRSYSIYTFLLMFSWLINIRYTQKRTLKN